MTIVVITGRNTAFTQLSAEFGFKHFGLS